MAAPTASATVTVGFTARACPPPHSPVRRGRPRPATRRAGWGRAAEPGGGLGDDGGVSSSGPFRALPPQVDLPALEQEVLGRWEADKVFARTLEASTGRPQWNFYEGPPTANGRPGTHHIEARAFKDVFPQIGRASCRERV